MANRRKRIRAIRRAPDGSAFEKWEEFEKTHENEVWIEIDRKGFQRWKDMTKEERCPYIFQAKVVNSAYDKTLLKEMDCTSEEDDEADSAAVGKFDLDYDDYYMYQGYDKAFESYDSFDYEVYLADSSFGEHGGHSQHGKCYQQLCVT